MEGLALWIGIAIVLLTTSNPRRENNDDSWGIIHVIPTLVSFCAFSIPLRHTPVCPLARSNANCMQVVNAVPVSRWGII